MSKLTKILVMTMLVLMIVSASFQVKATNADLTAYIGTVHNINGMLFELSNAQKATLNSFASKIDDATSDSIMSDIMAAENVIRNSGVTNHNQLNASQVDQVVSLAKSAASKAGAVLEVNLSNRTYKLTKNGKVVIAGNIDSLIVDPGTATGGGSTAAASASAKSKLLYTGANYALFAGVAVSIVAVAFVVKKRA